MKKIIAFIAIGIVGLTLIGCGGGDDSSSTTANTNTSTTPIVPALIESGTTSYYSGKPYNIKGNSKIYYETSGCRIGGLVTTNFEIYANGQIATSFSMYNKNYQSLCYVKGAYQKVDLNNTTDVNATFVNYNTFYDSTTKIYYDHNGYSGANYRLIQIINDGMNAIVDTGSGSTTIVQITDAYKKIDSHSIGITLYNPTAPFYSGKATDLMEQSFGSSISGKPYNVQGYLYNYENSGCSFNALTGSTYYIYNDGKMTTIDDNGIPSTCNITTLYQKVDLNNTTDANGTFVNYNTFYDNTTKIYYDHNGYSSANYRLIQIINDGMNAIVDTGSGSTTTVQITDAYSKI